MFLKPKFKEDVGSALLLYGMPLLGWVAYVAARCLLLFGARRKGVKFCLASIRFSYHGEATSLLLHLMRSNNFDMRELLSDPVSRDEIESRMIMLSEPRLVEGRLQKGVLLIKFTTSFSYLLRSSIWNEINEKFLFILEPSWAGYADADILAFLSSADHCIIQASETKDRAFINTVYPDVSALDIGSSNWVDQDKFCPGKPVAKQYDSIYIANLNPIKRVYRALDAFSNIAKRDANFRAIVVCASWGGSSFNDLKKYLAKKRVHAQVELVEGLSQGELSKVLRKTKVSILLSLKEGSNRSLFESLFSDVPVLCLSENIGVNKSYINDRTGLLCTNSCVEACLEYLYKNYDRYDPRKWALENISSECSTRAIRELISSRYSQEVNSELLVKVNSPEANYVDKELNKREINRYILDSIGRVEESVFLRELSRALGRVGSLAD
jgi:glycosyltransferase involved in cell wall biosynthesis